ncbi:uncharacterized protein LOC128992649 [Macrosteles quadrilineatus]|uniref:uncharacterized protein LOC128992649 n=1 Tax=Macrosteles quadrilineatus TaxID=74068 RepID=UPI0023E2E90C|nr:uncharacterized protein LOC128992649 [Macrosteles quadrilineatus]
MARSLVVTPVVVIVVSLVVVNVCGYQPYQYQGLQHHQISRANDQAALNYQKQILQWQQAVAQRAPQAPSLYSSPLLNRGYYGDYRQDAAPAAPVGPDAPIPGTSALPPQPTIQAPLPPGPPDTPPPPPQPLPEVDNQWGGETTTSQPAEGLKALCKAPRGQFPGTSCGKFVNCWDDVVVEQECPLGLYFNEATNFCDYAFNVACTEPTQQPGVGGGVGGAGGSGGSGGQYPGSSEFPGQTPDSQDLGSPGARCPTEFGTYRSTKNCGVFYMCVGYTPFEFTCPAGLNFHKDLQVCDYPYRVQCDGVPSNQPPPPPETSTVPEGETTYPTLSPGPPAPPSEPALLPEPTQGPEAAPAVAPAVAGPEAYYNLKKIPASLLDPAATCRDNTYYRLNPSCSSVAVCRNGITQVLNCGPGTAYDVYQQTCVATFRARC